MTSQVVVFYDSAMHTFMLLKDQRCGQNKQISEILSVDIIKRISKYLRYTYIHGQKIDSRFPASYVDNGKEYIQFNLGVFVIKIMFGDAYTIIRFSHAQHKQLLMTVILNCCEYTNWFISIKCAGVDGVYRPKFCEHETLDNCQNMQIFKSMLDNTYTKCNYRFDTVCALEKQTNKNFTTIKPAFTHMYYHVLNSVELYLNQLHKEYNGCFTQKHINDNLQKIAIHSLSTYTSNF